MPAVVVSLALALAAIGQPPDPPQETAEERQDRLQFLKEQAASVEVRRAGDSEAGLKLMEDPVLRYSNTERWDWGTSDGAMFLCLDGELPVAAFSFSIRRPNNGAYRECSSLTAAPLACSAGGTAVSSPKRGGLTERKLPDAPAPAAGKVQRLSQMRTIGRRFAVTCHDSQSDEPRQLRLLTTPVYRYAAEEQGIVDGAMFAFVISNDPEMLLLLEAVRGTDGSPLEWRYSLARMSSMKQSVRLDDKEVWSIANFFRDPTEDRRTGPYTTGQTGFYIPTVAPTAPPTE